MAILEAGSVLDVNTLSKIHSSIGEIRQTTLSEVEFNSINLGVWVLCDGRSCVGSAYEREKNMSTVPDFVTTGAFPRQAKEGRAIGSLEMDSLQGHIHTSLVAADRNGNPDGGGDSGGGRTYWRYGTTQYNTSGVLSDGVNGTPKTSQETRPVNVAINYFIKVSN